MQLPQAVLYAIEKLNAAGFAAYAGRICNAAAGSYASGTNAAAYAADESAGAA